MTSSEKQKDPRNAALEAIASRRAVRAFLPDQIPHSIIAQILEVAARAPSGSNIQPWHVDVVTGISRTRLITAITDRYDAGDFGEDPYQYYPKPWREPYLTRRRTNGWGLYITLGIERHEKAKMRAQHRRNFEFFGAPVGLIFTIDHDLPVGAWLDLGMFMQNVMIAARGFGFDTCPQQAFAAYHETIRELLDLPQDRVIVCAMALGNADMTDPANAFRTEREPLDQFTRFHV